MTDWSPPEAASTGWTPPEAQTRGPVASQIKKASAAQPPAPAKTSPRWSLFGDIGREAVTHATGLVQDVETAFPSIDAQRKQREQNRKNYGLIGGLLENEVDSGRQALATVRLPLDAIAVPFSLATGSLHATVGSALSYAMEPFTERARTNKAFRDTVAANYPGVDVTDPKAVADRMIDNSLALLSPRGGGRFSFGRATTTGPMEGFGEVGPSGEVRPGAAREASAQHRADTAAARQAKLQNKAADIVSAKAAADGLTAQNVLDAQNASAARGTGLSLMEIGKKNIRGLAGSVHRSGGEAGRQMEEYLDDRVNKAGDLLTKHIKGNVANGSTFSAMQEMMAARSEAAGPLFKDAFQSDSLAPFENQYRNELVSITSKKGQIAKQIAEIERNNPGALAARGAAGAETRERYMALRDQLDEIEGQRQSASEVFKRAQADKSANAPGAVWSPRLQQFLDNAEVQAGLKRALKLEKQDAISEGRPFKDRDFSIVGTDEAGDPILGAVPTMKSLAVAKEGLDAQLQGAAMRDPLTGRLNKAGLSLKKFRNAFVSELYRLNPKYKTAVDAWGGPSQSMEAMQEGRAHFSRPESNEQVKAEFDELSPANKEFYRLSAAEAKIDQIERAPKSADKTKRVVNSARDEARWQMLFDSPADADKFLKTVEDRAAHWQSRQDIKGGSQSAERINEDMRNAHQAFEDAGDMARIAVTAKSGNMLGALSQIMRMKRDLGMRNNPALNLEIAKILMSEQVDVNNSPGMRLIRSSPFPNTRNLLRGISAPVGGTNALGAAMRAPPSQPPSNP